MMIDANTIKHFEFFTGITEEQAAKIAEIASIAAYSFGEIVQYEGEECDAFYFVETGLVALEITMQQENHVTIDTIKPGELFGWSVFVPPHKVTAKSVCKEPSELIRISREPFLEIINNDQALKAMILERVLHIVAQRLKDTRAQLNYLLAWN